MTADQAKIMTNYAFEDKDDPGSTKLMLIGSVLFKLLILLGVPKRVSLGRTLRLGGHKIWG